MKPKQKCFNRLELYTVLSLNTVITIRQSKLKDKNDLPDWVYGL